MTGRTFWDRRRAAVEAEAQAEARATADADLAAREAELAEVDDAEILASLGLPDPETLGPGDDFKAFLTDVVPARIKTRALRRLWITNPVLANVDGLLDYGDDFTDAAMAVEHIQTAYQVGKGMTAHVEELARQAEAAAEKAAQDSQLPEADGAEDDATPEAESDLAVAATAPAPDADPAMAQGPIDAGTAPQPDADPTAVAEAAPQEYDDEMPLQAAPRRMRFVFDSAEETA